jgi:hypothetical protein
MQWFTRPIHAASNYANKLLPVIDDEVTEPLKFKIEESGSSTENVKLANGIQRCISADPWQNRS